MTTHSPQASSQNLLLRALLLRAPFWRLVSLWGGALCLFSLSACGASQQEREMISFLKESQAKIVQCEVDRSNAERDADLNRGQRELAEQKAEQAEASRLAVERENQALSQDLSKLKELIKQAAERGQLSLRPPDGSQGAQRQGEGKHRTGKEEAEKAMKGRTRETRIAEPMAEQSD